MKVYVLYRDIDYEPGYILSVHATYESAWEAFDKIKRSRAQYKPKTHEMSIDEWEVEE